MSYHWAIRWTIFCVVLFCATLEMPVLCNGSNSIDNDWKISVTASEDAHGEWQLDVVMEYHGEKSVELLYSEIPWKWPHALTVCAVWQLEFLSVPYPPAILSVDRPRGHFTVKPGETLKGAISLRSLFKRWDMKWFKGPVIVFWSYKFQTSKRVGGWIEIPQTKNPGTKKDNADSKEWELEAAVKKASSKTWNLKIAIKYHGDTDTFLQRYALPWEWPQSMIICAVPLNSQRSDPIERIVVQGDPPMSIMCVKPGEEIRGDINISPLTLFNHKSEVFRHWPVIVFWSFKCKSSNRVGGWFEVDIVRDSSEIPNNSDALKGGIPDAVKKQECGSTAPLKQARWGCILHRPIKKRPSCTKMKSTVKMLPKEEMRSQEAR